jgi:uncharacterized protein (UPF0254 family)
MTLEELERMYDVLDGRYMTRSECAKNVSREDEKIAKMELKLVRLDTKLSILIGILAAIGVPVIALCVKLLFGG